MCYHDDFPLGLSLQYLYTTVCYLTIIPREKILICAAIMRPNWSLLHVYFTPDSDV